MMILVKEEKTGERRGEKGRGKNLRGKEEAVGRKKASKGKGGGGGGG